MEHRRNAAGLGGMLVSLAFLPRRFTILSLAVMAGIALATAGLLDQMWTQVIRAQEQSAWDVAFAASGDFNHQTAAALRQLVRLTDAISFDHLDPGEEDRLKQDLRAAPEPFGALLVLDEEARVRLSTTALFKDGSIASDFKAAVADNDLVFAHPLTVGNERWLPVIRPIGKFGSNNLAIVAMLRLALFQASLAALPRDRQTVVGIVEPDGTRVLRVPALLPTQSTAVTPAIAKAIGAGRTASFRAVSIIDEVDKFVVVMPDGVFPFGVFAAIPVLRFFSIWWPQAAALIFLAASLLLTMMTLHATLASELYRRHQAEDRIATAVEEAQRIGAQYQLLAEHSSDVIIQIGFDRICRYVSPAMEDLLGWSKADLLGQDTIFLIHPDDREMLHEEVQFLTTSCGPIRSHYRQLHREGHYLWIEACMQVVIIDGKADNFVANLRDISDRIETERRLAEAASEMAQLAATDQLTGVANRRRFNQELEREWRRAAREELPLSLLMLDVDYFKTYNDAYGHQAGDDALKTVATTIGTALHRSADLLARWGGEEFVVLLSGTDLIGAIDVAERVRFAVETLNIPHRGAECGYLTISVGVATAFPHGNHAPEPLLAEADANLYEAKRHGRNRIGAPPTDPLIWVGY